MQAIKSVDKVFDEWQINEEPFSFHPIDYESHEINAYQKQLAALEKRLANHPYSYKQLENFYYSNHNAKPNHLTQLLKYIKDGDITGFIEYLKKNRCTSAALNKEENSLPYDKVMNKYNGLMQLLCAPKKRADQDKFLHTVAQYFFSYCFDPKTHNEFLTLLKTPKYHPLARMLYAIMWIHLGSKGWSTWHINLLNELPKDKEIVYIAGGTDIYQLIQHGFYNIRVIDPFLPTQGTYYSDGWRYLVGGRNRDAIGDKIAFDNDELILKRSAYKQTGTLRATLSNSTRRTLPTSTTKWRIYKKNSKLPVGSVTLERRFTNQKDFIFDPKKIFLLSFNELRFITTQGEDSWGIKAHKFDAQTKLYIKQLAMPLTKAWLHCIQKAEKSTELDFIELGNCID
jgi:hypothetical protein